ncbi:MAG: hypothetical protein ABWZ77_04495 [Naasia sp.]
MQLYSASPGARTRQIIGDAAALGIIIGSILLGSATWAAIAAFGEFGRRVADAGEGLRSSMADASDALGSIPLVGEAASTPFATASGVGADLVATGEQQQALVATVAVIAGLIVAVLPALVVLRIWLPRRVASARRAALVSRLARTPSGIDLLALRALGAASPDVLLEVTADPVGAWRAGDPSVIRRLADIQIAAAGASVDAPLR